MRIVFIGASGFGLRCLQHIVELDCCHVSGVVTANKKFSISYRPEGVTNVLHADVPSFCSSIDLPYSVIDNGMRSSELLERIEAWRPDAFLVVGWYHMIPRSWLSTAPAYGMHASLLPDYSGGAPLVWAMINGERETGITLFQMDDGVDSGPIVGQIAEPIHADDTIATLYQRIENRGIELLDRFLPSLADGSAELKPQDGSNRLVMPQRSPEDGRIDWSQTAGTIDRFIRAQTKPYPGAFFEIEDEKITVWEGKVTSIRTESTPGSLAFKGANAYVSCGDSTLLQIVTMARNGTDIAVGDWQKIRDAIKNP